MATALWHLNGLPVAILKRNFNRTISICTCVRVHLHVWCVYICVRDRRGEGFQFQLFPSQCYVGHINVIDLLKWIRSGSIPNIAADTLTPINTPHCSTKKTDIKHPRDIHCLCWQLPLIQWHDNTTTYNARISHTDYPIRSMCEPVTPCAFFETYFASIDDRWDTPSENTYFTF
jgi:hypothetical protein